MAAGSGSRYGKLKQFDTLGPHGEFLLEFSIYDAINNGFSEIVIVTREDQVSFLEAYFESKLPSHVSLKIIPQLLHDLPITTNIWKKRQKPWGTAHAIWAARKHILTPFVVINADDFYGVTAFKKAAHFIRDTVYKEDFGLVVYPLPLTLSENGSVSRGICEVKNDRLFAIHEKERIEIQDNDIMDMDTQERYTGTELVSMNFWICRPMIFQEIEKLFKQFLTQEEIALKQELFIPAIIQKMVAAKQIRVQILKTDSQWFGITYEKDRALAVDNLKTLSLNIAYTAPLWKTN